MKNDRNAIDHPRSEALNCLAGGLRLRQCDMCRSPSFASKQSSALVPGSALICTKKRPRRGDEREGPFDSGINPRKGRKLELPLRLAIIVKPISWKI